MHERLCQGGEPHSVGTAANARISGQPAAMMTTTTTMKKVLVTAGPSNAEAPRKRAIDAASRVTTTLLLQSRYKLGSGTALSTPTRRMMTITSNILTTKIID